MFLHHRVDEDGVNGDSEYDDDDGYDDQFPPLPMPYFNVNGMPMPFPPFGFGGMGPFGGPPM